VYVCAVYVWRKRVCVLCVCVCVWRECVCMSGGSMYVLCVCICVCCAHVWVVCMCGWYGICILGYKACVSVSVCENCVNLYIHSTFMKECPPMTSSSISCGGSMLTVMNVQISRWCQMCKALNTCQLPFTEPDI